MCYGERGNVMATMPLVSILFDMHCAACNDFRFQQIDKHDSFLVFMLLTICFSL